MTRRITAAEAQELVARATPGPWGVWSEEGPITLPTGKTAGGWSYSVCAFEGTVRQAACRDAPHVCVGHAFAKNDEAEHDACLMAAAPDLAASLIVLEAERDALRKAVLSLRETNAEFDTPIEDHGEWARKSAELQDRFNEKLAALFALVPEGGE